MAGAIGGLIFFATPMAAIAAAILLVDGRSMRNGEVTAVGRMLRSTGLDELPQLVNVLGKSRVRRLISGRAA